MSVNTAYSASPATERCISLFIRNLEKGEGGSITLARPVASVVRMTAFSAQFSSDIMHCFRVGGVSLLP